jgi:hypothetical protein
VVLQVNPVRAPVKAPVLNGWPTVSVVVAVSPPERPELVPYAKPRTVGPAPPVAVMLPLAVAVVCPVTVADCVVTVGAVTTKGVYVMTMMPCVPAPPDGPKKFAPPPPPPAP